MLDFLVDEDGVLRLKNSDWDDENLEAIRFLDLDPASLEGCGAAAGVVALDLSKSSVADVDTATMAAIRRTFPALLKIQFADGRTVWVPEDGGGVDELTSASAPETGGTLTITAAGLRMITDADGVVRVDGRQWGKEENCVRRLNF